MSHPVRTPPAARLYGAASFLSTPLLMLASRRARRGGPASTSERFGHGGPGDGRPRLWLHGASVGEAAMARTVLHAVLSAGPDVETVATAHTLTGRDALRRSADARTRVRLAPWDTPGAVARFRRGWSPAAYVFVDSELWPNRILGLSAGGAALVGANARISERSASRWARFAPGLAAALLSRIDLLCAQDDASAERFVRLGLPRDRLGPSEALKNTPGNSAPLADEEMLRARLPRARTILAASTHPGEEAMVLDAFLAAREQVPDLRLMIAPRHPDRGPQIAGLVAQRGFVPVLRSARDPSMLADDDAVYVADTIGELRRFYTMSALAFVGGSTGSLGGHTPFEPVEAGCVIAHGPDTANAAEAYEALDAAGAAIRVTGAAELADAFTLTASPGRLREMSARAAEALRPPALTVPDLVAGKVVTAIRAVRDGRAGT